MVDLMLFNPEHKKVIYTSRQEGKAVHVQIPNFGNSAICHTFLDKSLSSGLYFNREAAITITQLVNKKGERINSGPSIHNSMQFKVTQRNSI